MKIFLRSAYSVKKSQTEQTSARNIVINKPREEATFLPGSNSKVIRLKEEGRRGRSRQKEVEHPRTLDSRRVFFPMELFNPHLFSIKVQRPFPSWKGSAVVHTGNSDPRKVLHPHWEEKRRREVAEEEEKRSPEFLAGDNWLPLEKSWE